MPDPEQMTHDAQQELEGERYHAFEEALEKEFENNDTLDKAVVLLKDVLAQIADRCSDLGYAGDTENGTYSVIANALDELGEL